MAILPDWPKFLYIYDQIGKEMCPVGYVVGRMATITK
jgi:hypothetical protein